MKKNQTVQDILLHHYEEKKRTTNGAFSLRSYAKTLGVSPGRLNSLLNGTNIPAKKTVEKMARSLKLSTHQLKEFQAAVVRDKKNRLLSKADVIIKKEDLHIVVDWVPYAIMSLLMTADFELTPKNVATRLNIAEEKACENIEKLKSLRMILEVGGKWQASQNKIGTATDVPSEMIRRSHEEKISLALKRMHEVSVDLRDFSSITFPMDLKNIELAKKMIITFRRNLAEALSLGRPSEVYALNIQFFPLSNVVGTQE